VTAVMSRNPRTVRAEALVADAARVLRQAHVDQVPVVDADGRPVGLLDVQDLLAARVL
jgi:arabinose-5-phosphate isomerase